jgi:hypothetical protein
MTHMRGCAFVVVGLLLSATTAMAQNDPVASATMDRFGSKSRGDVALGYSDVSGDATVLHIDAFMHQYVTPDLGLYGNLGIIYIDGSGDSETLINRYRPTFTQGLELISRAGAAFGLETDEDAIVLLILGETRLNDLARHVGDTHWLRASLSPVWTQGTTTVRADLGVDIAVLTDLDVHLGPLLRANFGVASWFSPQFAAFAESSNLFLAESDTDDFNRFFHTIGIGFMGRTGGAEPYLAVTVPVGHDGLLGGFGVNSDFTVFAGVRFASGGAEGGAQ